MRAMKTNTLVRQLLRGATIAAVSLLANAAQAAAPGISARRSPWMLRRLYHAA